MRIPTRFTLTFGFAGLIIIIASLIIISSSLTSRSVLSRHATTIMENIASYTIDKAQSHLIPARKAARLTLGLSQNDIVSSNDAPSMEKYFYEQLYLHPQFSGIYFGNTRGEFTMASRYNKLEEGGYYTKFISRQTGKRTVERVYKSADGSLIKRAFTPKDPYDPRTRPWFQEAKKQGHLIWTDPYIFFTSQKPGITTANPVYDKQGKFIGVIGVDIEIEELSTFLSRLNVSKHGRAFILSQNGDVIAYPDPSKLQQTEESQKIRLTKIIELEDPVAREAFLSLNTSEDSLYLKKPVFTSFTYDNEEYHAMFAPFSDSQWPWYICIYMPEDDYLGSIKANRNVNIVIALIAVFISLIIGLLVAGKLSKARRMAESADKAKSQFLARMSHEIRTPMNAILGAGELLSETDLNSEQRKYINIYQNAGEHLRELVRDVLDLSRFEAGHFQLEEVAFNLPETAQKTCDVFSLEAQNKGLDLSCTILPGTPRYILGDPAVLKQVLVNLLSNAFKFTPTGSIHMTVDAIGRSSSNAAPDTITLQFCVTDTGIGVPSAKQKAIFDRFTQADGSTSRKYGGTGLGLSISQSLVKQMGGEISIVSKVGKGSAFTFTAQFRIDPGFGAELDSPTRPQKTTWLTSEPKRILLVEDDERNRMLFSLFMKDMPHELETAESGEVALSQHTKQPYDLILMDIEMGGMDGYETTQAIRDWEREQGSAPTPIIAVTAHAFKEVEEKAFQSGCTGYLAKPVTKATLRQAVEQHLRDEVVLRG